MDSKIVNGKMQVTDPYHFDMEGSLLELVDTIKRISDEVGLGLEDIDYYLDAWDGSMDVLITYTRPLTDKEAERERVRLEKSAARKKFNKEKKEAAERKEYERLKKRYG